MAREAYSYSRYEKYKKCPSMYKAVYLDKVPQGSSPALERGRRIHDQAEQYLLHKTPGKELTPWFMKKLDQIRDVPHLSTEQLWGYDWSFQPSDRGPIWVKLDALAFLTEDKTEALVIDYKTGRKSGNEISHMRQGQLYALGAFRKYPELLQVDVQFWYVDHEDETSRPYSRMTDETRLYMYWRQEFATMQNDKTLDPKAGWWCKYCPIRESCPIV